MTKEEIHEKQATEVRNLIEAIVTEAKTDIETVERLSILWNYEASLHNLYQGDSPRRPNVHIPASTPG